MQLESDLRHYEVVFILHPDQSEQLPTMIERYRHLIEESGGKIHRFEDWGRRPLAYPIQKVRKGHYALMNIECTPKIQSELENSFRFNDSILRNMILVCKKAETEPSAMMAKPKEDRYNKNPNPKNESHKSYSTDSPEN